MDGNKDPKGAETEHRKQELVLKKFRTRECNVLIGTSFLEEGIDLPKCNLVVRFNVPQDYRSYVFSKERARATDSWFCLLINDNERHAFIQRLAEFMEIEKVSSTYILYIVFVFMDVKITFCVAVVIKKKYEPRAQRTRGERSRSICATN